MLLPFGSTLFVGLHRCLTQELLWPVLARGRVRRSSGDGIGSSLLPTISHGVIRNGLHVVLVGVVLDVEGMTRAAGAVWGRPMLVPELVLLRDIDFEVDHGTGGVVRG